MCMGGGTYVHTATCPRKLPLSSSVKCLPWPTSLTCPLEGPQSALLTAHPPLSYRLAPPATFQSGFSCAAKGFVHICPELALLCKRRQIFLKPTHISSPSDLEERLFKGPQHHQRTLWSPWDYWHPPLPPSRHHFLRQASWNQELQAAEFSRTASYAIPRLWTASVMGAPVALGHAGARSAAGLLVARQRGEGGGQDPEQGVQ